jgi:Uma2 family endonuclease
MATAAVDRAGPWTFDQLVELPEDDCRYEVVDGLLLVSPPPSQEHQLIANGLLQQLLAQCPPSWRVLLEFALPLGTDGRVPDLCVIRAGAPSARGNTPFPIGPEHFGLVVEVVSPRSRKTDRFAKPGEYAEAGVPLFWRVELEPELAVHAFRLSSGAYVDDVVVRGAGGPCPVPWGSADLDLRVLRPQ